MKTTIYTILFFLLVSGTTISAQKYASGEKFGRTLNLGVGLGGLSPIGYYGYVGRLMPVLHADYEIDLVRNVTLAPFISFYSYRNAYYYSGTRYYYHEIVIPVGVKGSYYFDDLLRAGPKWDFYAAGSVGFAISNSYWDNSYTGDRDLYSGASPLFLDVHAGAEYHFNNNLGAFLDVSSNGLATIGFAIHKIK